MTPESRLYAPWYQRLFWFYPILSADEVASTLSNYGSWHSSKHPYRLVILNSCESYSKAWANAFGVLFSPDGSLSRVADYTRLHIDPNAFVAWTVEIPSPATATDSRSLGACLDVLHEEWMLGVPLNLCMKDYTTALVNSGPPQNMTTAAGIPLVKLYRISGCRDLTTYTR